MRATPGMAGYDAIADIGFRCCATENPPLRSYQHISL